MDAARWPAYRSRQREGVALENGRSSLSVRPLPIAPSLLFVIEVGVVIIVGVVRVQGAGLVRIVRARVARRLAARAAAAALPLHVALRVVAGLAGHGLMADRVDVFVIDLRPLRLEVRLRARKLSLSVGRVDVGHTGYGSGVTELSVSWPLFA